MPPATGLDIEEATGLAYLQCILGELIYVLNRALSSVICEFQRQNVLMLLHVLIACSLLVWPGLEPLPGHVYFSAEHNSH